MSTLQYSERGQKRRQGQTLAEFAITLPIVLILMFGIVEFGRIFQAWVTLQNAARAAARYASTGQYYDSQYVMNLTLNSTIPSDPTGFIPCVDDGPDGTFTGDGNAASLDRRGTQTVFYPNQTGVASDAIQVYQGGIESLFATWNDGRNCNPASSDDQERRRDMARILSIIEEARKGAAGLAIEANRLSIPTDKTVVAGQPWFQVWKNPQPGRDQRSWFNVVICSTRLPIAGTNAPTYWDNVGPQGPVPETGRFVSYLGDRTLRDPGGSMWNTASLPVPLPSPSCLLNEIPEAGPGVLNNAGKPWMDPGGPGDTVSIVITFNHPLITPLGIAPYIVIQARRTAIVEAFRAASVRSALGGGPPVDALEPTDTPFPTDTPAPTFTPIPTRTLPPPASITPSTTPIPPFTCSLITANNFRVNGGRIEADIRNQNGDATFLTRVVVKWPTILDFQQMNLFEMALNESPHWRGNDYEDINAQTNTTDTNTDASNPPNFFVNTSELDRTIASNDTGSWSATFNSGPTFLQQYVSISDFAGTTFYLYNPLQPNTPCAIQLTLPTKTPTPDPRVVGTNTPTYTPDCASSLLSVRWGGFDAFGLVRLEVRNERRAVAILSDFVIQWIQRAPGVLTLARVSAVAPLGQPNSVTVWQSGSTSQDSTPPTSGRSEGTWVQNFTFDAGAPGNPSVTNLYLDFDGVGGLLSDIGVTPSDFNNTNFRLSCGATGGATSGPGGGPPTGTINLGDAPTPAPTNTRGPTNTPLPTLTPSKTFTPSPPTNTPTIGPSNTPRPATNTPLPPTATVPRPPPTLPGGGCVDNCG